MAAVAALLTSCSKDDTLGGPTRGKVTFEVSTPELATRYGEGTTATNLKYAVYDMIEDATNGMLVDTGTATLNNKTANVSIDLVEGRKYTAIFWADAGDDSPYTFTPATKTVSYTNVNDLKANQEAYDAFYAFVPQADIKVGQTVSVTLKRPFAQLRIETSDTDRAEQLGVEVVKTGITVNAYTSFNLETGAVDGQQNISFKPTDKASAPRATVGEAKYDLISMNYVLVNTRETVDVTLNFTDDVNGTEQNYVRQYNAVSVERNHRTIVRGTILTDPTQFNVTVSEGFTDDINEEHNTSETLVVSTTDEIIDAFENLNDNDPSNDPGTIVLGDDIDLNDVLLIGSTSTINAKAQNSLSTNAVTRTETETETPTIVIDGNGKTISSKATRVIRIQQSNINVEINNLTIDVASEVAGNGSNPDSIRGISIDGNLQNVSLTLNNCNIEFTDDEVGKDWAYAVNVVGGSGHKVTINGGKYNGANVINVHGDNNIVTVNNATLTSLYPANDTYGACIWTKDNQGSKVFAKGNTFNGDNAIAFNLGEGTELTESDNIDNCLDYKEINGNYCIFTADGLVWVEAQTDGFFAGKTVKLMSDIDMTDVTIANPIKFWNPENRTTFDGQNHTISNLTMSTTSTARNPFSLFTGTADIMNVKFDNANISGYSYVAVVAGNLYGNIENCHVSNSSVKCTYWMAGALSGQYNSGNVTNCSVTNTTVTGPAAVGALVGVVNETSGERKLENCTVTDCNVIQEGSFGGDYDKMFGAAVGLINIENSTVRFNGTVTNTTVKGEASSNDNIFGDLGSNNNVYINTKLYVPKSESQKKLEAAIAAAKDGEIVTLSADLTLTETLVIPEGKNITLDLKGKTLTAGADGYAINNDKGGNLTIEDSATTGIINGVVYTENGNTTINGGTYNAIENEKFVFLNSKGTLTINKATINGGSSYPIYSYDPGSKLVINDVTVKATFGCVNSYGTGGVVEINGGTFEMTGVQGKTSHIAYFSNVDATINNGTFRKTGDISMSAAGGGGICAIYGANLTIKGGNFAGDYADVYNWSGTNANGRSAAFSIQGGTFKFKPSVAEGYKATQNTDGTWTVTKNE